MSSTRLSKLSQYLNDGNYEQAVQLYDKKIQEPKNQQQYLLLAKAYFVGQHYSTVLQILKKIHNNSSIKVQYEAIILKIKAKYIYSTVQKKHIQQLEWLMNKFKTKFTQYHFWCLNQIKFIVQKQFPIKGSNFSSRQVLNSQKYQFMQILKQSEDFSDIMEGMPVYLISKRWYDQWEQFVSFQSKVTGQNPGPITNFQIVDHIYNGFYDSRKQKQYTNHYLFQPCKYKIIPKKCWQFLSKKYGGLEVVRYNISDLNRPNQIYAQVYLKKIIIANNDQLIKSNQKVEQLRNNYKYVQITRKQNWKGLIQNKLELQWGENGTLLEYDQRQNKKIDLNRFLEDSDTAGKVYIYIPNSKQQQLASAQKCGNKECNKQQFLKNCQCKTIKYCGKKCQQKDRDRHWKKCQLQMSHFKQKSAIIENFNLSEKQYSGRKGLVGLRNLGNTCYMNSGLQCLSNTKQITDYFMSNGFLKDINNSNPLGTKGNLACAYAQLMRQMWAGKDDVVSPFNLKKMIGKFATQFSGFGQQDSQQFISYLIDGLQQDLNLVKKKQVFQTKDQVMPDQQGSLQSQRNYQKRIKSYIRDLMAGQFKSTVTCLTCKKISICFDPYLLISLPVPTPKIYEVYIVNTDLAHGAVKLSFQITDSTTLKQLDAQIRRQYKSFRNLIYVKVDKQSFAIVRIIQNINEAISIQGRQSSSFLFAYQLPQISDDTEIYFAEYWLDKERVGFPRFLKFSKKNFERDYQSVIENSYERVSRASYQQNVESIQNIIPSQPYNKICNKMLNITLKKNLKLLTFKQNKDFQFSRSQNRHLTLYDCLSSYSKTQLLQKQNEWYCNKCKKFQPAEKQIQIYKSNKILVLAFKRFSRFRKLKTFIDFPIEDFDIGPFLRCNKEKKPVLYDLYGVVNHYGSLGGGHYTAYSQNFLNKRWYEFNDSRVSQVSRREIVSDNSYVLFFRRKN